MASSSLPAIILGLLVFLYGCLSYLRLRIFLSCFWTYSLIVENSTGSKLGTKVKVCVRERERERERVMINGLPRITHLETFANSVKVNVSFMHPRGRPPNVEVCFRRNVSLGIGICPQDQWEKLNKAVLVKSMSPFDHKILDIRMDSSLSETLQVSIYEEHFKYRICFLVLGFGNSLDDSGFLNQLSLVSYYSGAMAIGFLLVILIVLFQGMNLLPTGRKSSLGIFLYSCFVGLASFLLSYVPRLLRSLLTEIGHSEDIAQSSVYVSVGFHCVGRSLAGLLGCAQGGADRRGGSVDVGVAHFVTWSIRIVSSLMIFQSSADPLLAIEALMGWNIIVSSVLKASTSPKAVRRVYKKLHEKHRKSQTPYSSPFNNNARSFFHQTTYILLFKVQKVHHLCHYQIRITSTLPSTPLLIERSYRRRNGILSLRKSTRKALQGLVSSPGFSRWAIVAHADRITLPPKQENADKRRRWFGWF